MTPQWLVDFSEETRFIEHLVNLFSELMSRSGYCLETPETLPFVYRFDRIFWAQKWFLGSISFGSVGES